MSTARPELHLTSRSGWINDPLGRCVVDGLHHVFFQSVPGSLSWDMACSWGHAVSDDGLSWRQVADALSPDAEDDGCFSGCVVTDSGSGSPTIFYTSVSRSDIEVGAIRTATPLDPGLRRWTKGRTVVTVPHRSYTAFRDPFVFAYRERWRMVVGGRRGAATPVVLGFESDDLGRWRYLGEFAAADHPGTDLEHPGVVWECPQVVQLGDDWLLLFSVLGATGPQSECYAVGRVTEAGFEPSSWGRLTYGGGHYAGTVHQVPGGGAADQVTVTSWLRGVRGRTWTGALSLPRTLHVTDGAVTTSPHSSLAGRRTGRGETATPGHPLHHGRSGPVELEWRLPRAGRAQLHLTCRSRIEPLMLESSNGLLRLRDGTLDALPLDGDAVTATVRIIVDGSIIEVFSDEGTMATSVDDTWSAFEVDEVKVSQGGVTVWPLSVP